MSTEIKEVIAQTSFFYWLTKGVLGSHYEYSIDLHSPIIDIDDFSKKYTEFINSYLELQEHKIRYEVQNITNINH